MEKKRKEWKGNGKKVMEGTSREREEGGENEITTFNLRSTSNLKSAGRVRKWFRIETGKSSLFT